MNSYEKWDQYNINQFDIVVFIGGSCLCSPEDQEGGWSFTVLSKDQGVYSAGYSEKTSYYRITLTAIMKALTEIKRIILPNQSVIILSNNSFVIDGLKNDMPRYVKNNWQTQPNDEVSKRIEIFKPLFELAKEINPVFKWVQKTDKIHGADYIKICKNLAKTAVALKSNCYEIFEISDGNY
jgi:ribonuclease HI